jgi:hypothetical protein
MDIKLSKAVELVKTIKAYQISQAQNTKIYVGITSFTPEGHMFKIHNHIIDLDQEDLEYLYNKYKPKALMTLDGLKDYAEELKEEL